MKKIFLFSLLLSQIVYAQDPVRHEELGYKYTSSEGTLIDVEAYIKDNGGIKAPSEVIEHNFIENNLEDPW